MVGPHMPDSQGSCIVVLAGLLIDGTGEPARRGVALRVEGGFIQGEEEIDSFLQSPPPPQTTIVDCRNGSVSPGLIDAHVHLAWSDAGHPSWPLFRDSSDLLLLWAA